MMDNCSSLHHLRVILGSKGTAEGGREEIKRLVPLLSFKGQQAPLPATGFNISQILDAIANESIEEQQFPIHPTMVLERERKHRLWSAFGAIAPSFIVAGGKKMDLGKPFDVSERDRKGERSTKTVRKVGFVLKPLGEAIKDLNTVLNEHTIHNPHGSSLMQRSSSQSLIRTLENDQCDLVIASLRRAAKVTVSDESGAGKGKRKEDHFEEERGAKRRRADDI